MKSMTPHGITGLERVKTTGHDKLRNAVLLIAGWWEDTGYHLLL
jgi:hypothetical protein